MAFSGSVVSESPGQAVREAAHVQVEGDGDARQRVVGMLGTQAARLPFVLDPGIAVPFSCAAD